jgi:DNA-binding transcriptional regulator GbsR (MarR family)
MAQAHDFADRLGRFFEDNGLPRMAGRVMGHLLTCDPPEQTFDEVVEAVGASRSSVSVATRLLVQLGLAERFGLPGERRDRYRLREDAWAQLLRQDMAVATELKRLAEDGLALVESQPPAGRARLSAMREFYAFLEEAYAPLLAQWERRRQGAREAGVLP